MINLEIVAFIEQQKSIGVADNSIRQALLAQGGWTKSDITEAFAIVNLPKGSIQAAAFRAATMRAEKTKKEIMVGYNKIFVLLALLAFTTFLTWIYYGEPVGPIDLKQLTSFNYIKTKSIALSKYGENKIDRGLENLGIFAGSIFDKYSKNKSAISTSTPIFDKDRFNITDCGQKTFDNNENAQDYLINSDCFAEYFSQCKPASITTSIKEYNTAFDIMGIADGACVVSQTIINNAGNDVLYLQCSFDPKKSWKEVQDDMVKVCRPPNL